VGTFVQTKTAELRGGLKKKVMEFSIRVQTHPPTPLNGKKTWSKKSLNYLKCILKATCFPTFMRPHLTLEAEVVGWVRGGS